MTLATEQARRHDLTLAFLTPPVAWSVYFLVVYPAASTVCGLASDGARPLLANAVYGSAIALTVIVALAIAVSGVVNWRRLRELRAQRPSEQVREDDPHIFMAYVGLLMSGFFFIGTFFLALPMVILGEPCR